MGDGDFGALNRKVRDAWNENAGFWDRYMGDEGNRFTRHLVWPAAERLLAVEDGERVLEIACGNGNFARRLAANGAEIVAIDFAEEMVRRAEAYEGTNRIDFRVLDATDRAELLGLGVSYFDAAVCNMALMDMAEIGPLASALPRLLKPPGRVVFTIMHPCFNANSILALEQEDREGEILETYSVKISQYLLQSPALGIGVRGQPTAQYYIHRPLHELLAPFFSAGFAMDVLEEPAFTEESEPSKRTLGWGPNFSQIPPVLAVRLKLSG